MIKKIVLVLIFIILVFPVYFMLIGSFQDIGRLLKMPPSLLPYSITLNNYILIFKWPIFRWIINTLLVVSATVLISVLLSSLTGYAFAFYKYKYKKLIWNMLLIGIMIPRISLIIPTYIIIKKLGIQGSLLGVILPTVLAPFSLYLARNYFETIPFSLLESARLDGANELQIIYKIIVPMSKPIITALALFASIASLQDYIWQMLVLQNEGRQTLLVGLVRNVMQRGGGDLNINPLGRGFAVGIILLIPLLIIFLVANKYFTQSLGGAIKE
jgi:ABC-type glycerol-3-phosphate transport system permease component